MTKEQVLQKIKEILAKDKRFVGTTIKINFVDKNINSLGNKIKRDS